MLYQPSPLQSSITLCLIRKLGSHSVVYHHSMTATPQLYWQRSSSKGNVLIFQFVNDPQQGYRPGPPRGDQKNLLILSSFKLSQTTQNMGSYSEGSSEGTSTYLMQWTCSGSSTRKQGMKNEFHIMSLWQRAGVNCSTDSEHQRSWHKWRKFFTVWLGLLDGCYSALAENNAIQKIKWRRGPWASAKVERQLQITIMKVKIPHYHNWRALYISNDWKILWVNTLAHIC